MTPIEHMTSLKPSGTTGLAVAPWGWQDACAVAANWDNITSPVYAWCCDCWRPTAYQVVEFGRRGASVGGAACAALRHEIVETVTESGDEKPTKSQLAAWMEHAAEF